MVSQLINEIKTAAKELHPVIKEIRRDLHMHPELSFAEKRTSEQVRKFLLDHKIPFTDGWAGHGIVATIKGDHTGPSVMLRADMDALPIHEENDISYKSLNPGVMHACGHDVHTSCVLGAAAIINRYRDRIYGEVKLIFQPGEEKLPGGASMMIKEGLFKNDTPDWIIGQHVHPPLEAGHIGYRSGLYMASADEIYIAIKGKGGHAATPHLCIDPIVMAARVVTGLQEIISRTINPLSPGVLTLGRIYSAGGATNVIPDVVHLEGTLRAMDEKWRIDTHHHIRHFVENTCKASGGEAEVNIVIGYPCLVNNESITEMCRLAAIAYLGEENVHELPPRMTSEDFAFYSQVAPASFYRLGTGWAEADRNYPIHSNRFDINEMALETGMGLMAFITLSNLSTSA